MPAPQFRNALPQQSMLHEYRVEQVLDVLFQLGELAGKTAKEILDAVVADPGYDVLLDWQKRALFERVVRAGRGAARSLMIPELGEESVIEQKLKRFQDAKPD